VRSRLHLHTATGSLVTGTVVGLVAGFLMVAGHVGRTLLDTGRPTSALPSPRDAGVAEPSAALLGRRLEVPVQGVSRATLADTFTAPRGGARVHRAVDVMAPRGTAVVAVDDGTVARLQQTGAGGIAVYQHDSTGRYCFYYAHLDGYARGLAAGQPVARGQILGFVGSTGNASASAPHLHFAITEIDPATRGCHGRAVNPVAVLR
jgi:peptidoglycan LD-endopeptidase LytH